MSKRCAVIDPCGYAPQSSGQVDWSKCMFCQKNTNEKLQCPADSKRGDVGVGYESLADLLPEFSALEALPQGLSIARLDEGFGIPATLTAHRASWHKSCRKFYYVDKLERLKARANKLTLPPPSCNVEPSETGSPLKKICTRSESKKFPDSPVCFICHEPASSSAVLHDVSTENCDSKVKEYAKALCDHKLYSEISAGDLMAHDRKYHLNCLAGLYNRMRSKNAKANNQTEDVTSTKNTEIHAFALAELVSYIEEVRLDSTVAPVFKMSDLTKRYAARVSQLGVVCDSRVNSTRLRDRIMSHFTDMQATVEGKEVYLVFNNDVGPALLKACQKDIDSEVLLLSQAANILRSKMFSSTYAFNGSFSAQCQQNAVPQLLSQFVSMLLDGSSIESQSNVQNVQPALTIAQLIMFNSVKHARTETGNINKVTRKSASQDMPLPIYVGLLLHARTRKRSLVDALYDCGLCISYDRLLTLSTELANGVCDRFSMDNLVCPPALQTGLFTVCAVDNIDHNPSATTASSSFHGTSISIMQQAGIDEPCIRQGHEGTFICPRRSDSKSVPRLPDTYTTVPPAKLHTDHPTLPEFAVPYKTVGSDIVFPTLCTDELQWASDVSLALQEMETPNVDKWVSWSAYNASKHTADSIPPSTISALLPLFREPAHSVAMICHSLQVLKRCTSVLNPGQVPVVVFDQPLYAIAKTVQWNWPNEFGEDKFIIMMGGLHIEMACMKALGSFLTDSGWIEALTAAGVTTSGTAESFLTASHLRRCRQVHEITAAALHCLQERAYDSYKLTCDESQVMTFDIWQLHEFNSKPQFAFWSLVKEFELASLTFVRAIRSSNFELYVQTLKYLVAWFFALDRTNYARWLPVHIRDLELLKESNANILHEFHSGKFTVKKTRRLFSAMAIDQGHEQLNKMIKEDGGAIGLTENDNALRRWMIAGPEIARLVNEFAQTQSQSDTGLLHHEQQHSTQRDFLSKVKSLIDCIEEIGNPFLKTSPDLSVLHSHVVVDQQVAKKVQSVVDVGRTQYKEFVQKRLIEKTVNLYDPLPRNSLCPFTNRNHTQSKAKQKLDAVTNDCTLFSRLYIGCQTRNGNLDEFFAHENQATPPALSDGNNLKFGSKSDLLECFDKLSPCIHTEPLCSVHIVDGAVLVQMTKPNGCRTFEQYANEVFIPKLCQHFLHANRVDLVWDTYSSKSLKHIVRKKRGSGMRRHVVSNAPMPTNWQDFLHVDANKSELFDFLSDKVSEVHKLGKHFVVTKGTSVLSPDFNYDNSNVKLHPCNHEEADTRIILHAANAAEHGHKSILIRTVDTDVVVLGVSFFHKLHCDELWFAFGSGKHFRYIAAHELANTIGPQKSRSLLFFHALTGCDTVSAFGHKGKKSAWDTLNCYPECLTTFQQLGSMPLEIGPDSLAVCERFVVLLYDRTSCDSSVNSARKHLFSKKGRTLDNIPPSQDSLIQHLKRAAYQAGHVWAQAIVAQQCLASPAEWGWKLNQDEWQPVWMTLPQAASCCPELISCGCKTGCTTRRCKCVRAELQCTGLCWCDGECNRML